MAPFREGMRVQGRFRLLTAIGAGGMSQVWRAHDEVLGREVAMKLLAAPGARPAPRSATVREARLAAGLTHPNLTQVYDCGEATLPDGTQVPYLVMELVDGANLADRLAGGPLPWPEVARIGAELARALASVHQAGVVHRDVKPANVVLTPAGAKLLDFGIAARCGARAERGRLVGTPTYAAPERIDADPAAPETDVYSLGVLCYEALTGRPPLELPSWEHAMEVRRRSPGRRGGRPAGGSAGAKDTSGAELAGVPEPLARLCLACLATAPADRPGAEQVAAEFAALADQPAPPPPHPSEVHPAARPPAAHPDPQPAETGPPEPARPYAVGTAPRPDPPTTPGRTRPRPRRGRRLAFVGLALLTMVAVVLSAGLLWPGALGRWVGTQSITGPGITAAAPERSAQAPADPYGAVSQVDQTISRALATGAIDRVGARELRERLDEVYMELDRADSHDRAPRVGGKATELREEIERQRVHGDLKPGVAERLTAQLAPLGGA